MSDVSDKFHLFLSVTPVIDFFDAASGSSDETDLVFEAVSFSNTVFCGHNLSVVQLLFDAPLWDKSSK